MDSFKIILTFEQNKSVFSAVPHKWEENNYVYWPAKTNKNKLELLRSNPKSEPEKDWKKYKCIVKCSNILTFKEALQIEKQFCECSDTESEQTIFTQNKKDTAIHHTINRNDMFELNSETQNSSVTDRIDFLCDENTAQQVPSSVETVNMTNENEVFLVTNYDMNDLKRDIAEIKSDQVLLNQELTRLKEQYVKININLDKNFHIITNKQHDNIAAITEENQDMLSNFKFPLASLDEVNRLNKELQTNKTFKSFLIRELSKIGGTNGTEDGFKVGYKLTDYIFQPELLTAFSWTGVSRFKNDCGKKSFNSLQGICELYYDTILLADNRHTVKKNECLFKDGVLKHAKKRCSRKRLKPGNKVVQTNNEQPIVTSEHNISPEDIETIGAEKTTEVVET